MPTRMIEMSDEESKYMRRNKNQKKETLQTKTRLMNVIENGCRSKRVTQKTKM